MKKWAFSIIILLTLVYWGCQKEVANDVPVSGSYKLKVTFNNTVGGQPMQLGATYTNPFAETYTLTAFRYYISNVVLHQSNGSNVSLSDFYHLVDQADAGTQSFTLPLTQNKFTRITFTLGVDSVRNVSGTQTGDLDPAKGMFWTWNSGYIMAKLEANSPVSPAAANKIEWHIGGFKTGENAIRQISLDLSVNPIEIKNNGTSDLLINAEANKWFNGVTDLKIAENPVCAMPGLLATKFADNYSKMFSIAGVNNN